jgi:hypothetical protein
MAATTTVGETLSRSRQKSEIKTKDLRSNRAASANQLLVQAEAGYRLGAGDVRSSG